MDSPLLTLTAEHVGSLCDHAVECFNSVGAVKNQVLYENGESFILSTVYSRRSEVQGNIRFNLEDKYAAAKVIEPYISTFFTERGLHFDEDPVLIHLFRQLDSLLPYAGAIAFSTSRTPPTQNYLTSVQLRHPTRKAENLLSDAQKRVLEAHAMNSGIIISFLSPRMGTIFPIEIEKRMVAEDAPENIDQMILD